MVIIFNVLNASTRFHWRILLTQLKNRRASLLKKLYKIILESCDSPKALYVLGITSLTESAFFIIPPEIMMLPMCYAKPKRSMYYALVTTLSSVLGAFAGWLLGYFLWDIMQEPLFTYIKGFEDYFVKVGQMYKDNAATTIFMAAFTPIPFKVITVAAGVYHINLPLLLGVSFIGRGLRYFLLAGLVMIFGEKAKEIIEKHFTTATIVIGLFAALIIYFFKIR